MGAKALPQPRPSGQRGGTPVNPSHGNGPIGVRWSLVAAQPKNRRWCVASPATMIFLLGVLPHADSYVRIGNRMGSKNCFGLPLCFLLSCFSVFLAVELEGLFVISSHLPHVWFPRRLVMKRTHLQLQLRTAFATCVPGTADLG